MLGGGHCASFFQTLTPVSNTIAFARLGSDGAFQIVLEKTQLDRTQELGSRRSERNVAELFAVPEMPAAMLPRAHHQRFYSGRRLAADGPESLERTREILGIVPAAHHEHGWRNGFQVWKNVTAFPECVISRVR